MKKKFLYIFVLILSMSSCGIDNNIKKGEKYLAIGDYYDASTEYKKAYSKIPSKERAKRGEVSLKMGYCYQRINATQKAIAAYRNAVRYNSASIDTHLSLAKQLMKVGSYKEANKEFQLVIDSLKAHAMIDTPSYILAINGLKSSQVAPIWKQQGSRYTIKKADVFNSRRDDYSPMFAGDQHDQLYFTSTRNEAEGDELSGITGTKNADIFLSEKDEKGKWSKPEVVTGGVNSTSDEGACSFSKDGREMYLTQCIEDGQYPRYATIVKSSRSDASWGKGSVIELTKDTLSSYAHPAISPDGNWLYFTSDMSGGFGGFDIWRARITPAGMGPVENLGPQINTPGDEMFPAFRPNGDFYFASDGHIGMGGLDIIIAKVGKDLRWHTENPGFPLNSSGDDFGVTFEGLLNQGFFCSNRADQGRGWDKIYSFSNPEIVQTVKGWVYERDGYELPQALVYMIGNDGTNYKISVKGDGSFEQQIEPNVDYVFLATCEGYLNQKEELRVDSTEESKEYVLQFPLANISIPTLIRNIFYDFDKATLRPESAVALDSLVTMLNENSNITIEIGAHCDYRGSGQYNLTLSQKRAESVVKYLIEHGIAAERLTPKGYGEEKPKTVRKRIAETYPWLKENDILTEEFILKRNKEEQEICNQLNRRTEFTVLRTTYGMFDDKGNLKDIPTKTITNSIKSNENDQFELFDIK